MIRTIVFDIGNVLADFNWREYLEEYRFGQEKTKQIAAATFQSRYWVEMDRGVLSDEEICEEMSREFPQYRREIAEVVNQMYRSVHENDYAAGLVKTLKEKGYQVLYLSNYGKTPFERALKQFSFFQYMDGGVVSYRVKQVKPDPDIYETLIRAYSLVPEETVFLDDRRENLEAAKAFQFHTVHVTDHYASIKEGLGSLGIELD